MSRFIDHHKRSPAILAALVVWLAGFELATYLVRPARLDEPISLSPPGHVEKEIRAPLPEPYSLELQFWFDKNSREKVRRLAGNWIYRDGRQMPSGVAVPIRWSVRDKRSDQEVVSDEATSFGSNAFSATYYARPVGRLELDRGTYRVRVEVVSDVPQFSDVPVRIALAQRPKVVTHWIREWEFWGLLINYFILGPLAVRWALLLAGLQLRDRRRARGAMRA
jgi:Domain of unknown function (DUF5625)